MVHAKVEKVWFPFAIMFTRLSRLAPKFSVPLKPKKYIASIQKRSAVRIQPGSIRSTAFSEIGAMQISYTRHVKFRRCLSVSVIRNPVQNDDNLILRKLQRNGTQYYRTDAGQIGIDHSPVRRSSCITTLCQRADRQGGSHSRFGFGIVYRKIFTRRWTEVFQLDIYT